MKKIFYTIILILNSVYLYADSVNPGTPGTINITTTTPDRSRNIGDKINDNFRMLSSTIGSIIDGSIVLGAGASNPSTVTLQGNIISISSVAGGLNTVLASSETTWLPLDASTNTKLGGINLNGQINSVIISQSSMTTQGNALFLSTNIAQVNTIITSSSTVWLPLDATTNTKVGGLSLNGKINNVIITQSSLTVQGNTVNISSVAGGLNTILVSSGTTWMPLDATTNTKVGGITLNGQINNVIISQSSTTTQGNTVTISSVASGLNAILVSSQTTWLPLDSTTNTKTGGLTLNGQINNVVVTQSSLTVQGNTISISSNAGLLNSIYSSSGTTFLLLDQSTNTKSGGLTINGRLTVGSDLSASSMTVYGGSITLNPYTYIFQTSVPVQGQKLGIESITGNTITTKWSPDASPSSSDLRYRNFMVIVGTLGAVSSEVDIASNTTDGLVEAMSRVQALGLLANATVEALIMYRTGNYTIGDTTNYAGVKIFASEGSSVVWNTPSVTSGIITNYGTIDGISFDFRSFAYNNRVLIDLKSNSKLVNFKAYNGDNQATANPTNYFRVQSVTNVVVNGEIINCDSIADVSRLGDGSMFYIRSSTKVYVNLHAKRVARLNGLTSAIITVDDSRDIHIQDGNIEDGAGLMPVRIHKSSRDIFIERNTFGQNAAGLTRGYIGVWDDTSGVSSGIIINGNHFVFDNTGAGKMIAIGQCDDAAQGAVDVVSGLTVMNNTAYMSVSNTWVFIKTCSTDAQNTIIMGNRVDGVGTFITDNGVATKNTGNDNFYNSIEQ